MNALVGCSRCGVEHADGIWTSSFHDTLIWRLPLDDHLLKQGLASRSECANLGAGGRRFKSGRPDHQQYRSTALPRRPVLAAILRAPVSCH
jgi:hypothetical protein